jgi:hypothetical protein
VSEARSAQARNFFIEVPPPKKDSPPGAIRYSLANSGKRGAQASLNIFFVVDNPHPPQVFDVRRLYFFVKKLSNKYFEVPSKECLLTRNGGTGTGGVSESCRIANLVLKDIAVRLGLAFCCCCRAGKKEFRSESQTIHEAYITGVRRHSARV